MKTSKHTRQMARLAWCCLILSGMGCSDPVEVPECLPGDLGCVPSAQRVCHTPCKDSLTTEDGTFRACSPDGLMEGCIGDNICVAGSCVQSGQAPRTCLNERQCPDFQACIKGQCYANCAEDSDCFSGTLCQKRVCRAPCLTSDPSSCAEGAYCDSYDGQNGFCRVSPQFGQALPPGLVQQAQEILDTRDDDEGQIEVSLDSVKFSNIKTEATFTITNKTRRPLTAIIHKTRSHIPSEGGGASPSFTDAFPEDEGAECDPALDCPLSWLKMSASGSEEEAGSIKLGIDTDEEVEVVLSGADALGRPAWTGELTVGAENNNTIARQTIALTYASVPSGLWSGDVFFFANFNELGLEQWRNNPDNSDLSKNALLARWSLVRNGTIGWDEFLSVLTSLRTGSWNSAATREACDEPSGACYPYPRGERRVQTLTTDLASEPVPGGVVELPMALNLTLDSNDSALMTGRINSSAALQYAGNPAFQIAARSPFDSGGCDGPGKIEGFGHCLTFLAAPSGGDGTLATIDIGGRFSGGESCGNGFARASIPWLLPGFEGNTTEEDGVRIRRECRHTGAPFEGAPQANTSLSLGNPVPDGGTRRRKIEFIDGAMIDQRQLFIIFEEQFDSFLDPEGNSAGFSAYGIMILERTAANLEDDAFEGTVAGGEPQSPVEGALDVACSEALIQSILPANTGGLDRVDDDDVDALVETLIDGIASTNNADALCTPESKFAVHYVCVDTGRIDGGPGGISPTRCGTGDKFEEVSDQFGSNALSTIEYYLDERLPNNSNNCADDRRDVCQDGGQGSTVEEMASKHACVFGTDLRDCGLRTPVEFLNTNNCPTQNNRICEDGGVGSVAQTCALGQDADDCPHRLPQDFDNRVACPPESEVIFFAVPASPFSAEEDMVALPCVATGTCVQEVLEGELKRGGGNNIPVSEIDPPWHCTDDNEVLCDNNRFDLREGKTFYRRGDSGPAFTQLLSEVKDAFRYKTRFRSRQGKGIGFTPQICLPGDSSQLPYCYDPAQIEVARARLDCLLEVWQGGAWDTLSTRNKQRLKNTLVNSFSFTSRSSVIVNGEPWPLPEPLIDDGFEHLNAELMVMLGDDALTRAFSSRFDLAGASVAAFDGVAFEGPEGINLSGIAGSEMRNLHQAVQYYQEVLDRFYRLSPLIFMSTTFPERDNRNFVTPEMLTSYVQRVLSASTQRSRAGSEIALRYLSFNRPDLSRRVIERFYTAAYLESTILSRMMLRFLDVADAEDKAQIIQATEDAQLRYNQALFRMREVYGRITDDTTFFGLPPDLVPFPTLENVLENNAFEVLFERAKNKAQVASAREDRALADTRGFETDAAEFQSELASLKTTYENQLAEICGTFVAEDGRILPAIEQYADLDPKAQILGDPCGFMGTGQINDAIAELEIKKLDVETARRQVQNVYDEIEIEIQRLGQACDAIIDTANVVYNYQGEISNLQRDISSTEAAFRRLEHALDTTLALASLDKCTAPTSGMSFSPGNCVSAKIKASAYTVAAGVFEVGAAAAEIAIVEQEDQIRDLEREQLYFEIAGDCDMARIDSHARISEMILKLKVLELDGIRAGYEVQLGLSRIAQLRNQGRRLELEQDEAQQHLINIEAARNDPNVRIYKNDAVLNADFAFDDAMREAFRATRVFEYYTSQSFGPKADLFLIRMASFGQPNLENYLTELENAFFEFEEFFGLPETRVMIISLRDDIVPTLNPDGQALSEEERDEMMRAAFQDPRRLDRKGYLTFPFSTNLSEVSPATRNHKIKIIEAEMIGDNLGDSLARLYLRQRGTSIVRPVRGSDCLGDCFYNFPQKLAVLNPFFEGERTSSPIEIYQNAQFTDRPLINTSWELVFNRVDEAVNKDIDLSNLTDIKLYFYYSDFTDID